MGSEGRIIKTNQPRIISAVSESWGHGTVYTYDTPAESTTMITSRIRLNHQSAFEKMTQDVTEVLIPEQVDFMPVEGLSFLTSFLYATVLEDIIAQMWTLERCNNELSISKTMSDLERLKAIKYGVCDPNEVKDELEGVNYQNLENIIYKIKKLETDRKYVTSVIVSTYIALAQSFNYQPLIIVNRGTQERIQYRIELEEEESKNRSTRKELIKQLRQQRNHIKTVLYDTDVIIDKLRTEVEDSVLYSEVRNRYIDNWQLARTEQHTQTIFDVENGPSTHIEYYKQQSEYELRVHTELELLVNITINETLAKIEDWMNKYDEDMEKIDLKIQIKKNDYQNTRDKRIELEDTIARHDVQMKEWIAFKQKREKARAYHEKMTNAAIAVQAWWRGLLVRLEIGPFRPKKGKRPLPGEEEKKKKKK